MSRSADKIVAEALALPPHANAFVAECLIESLDTSSGGEISPAWRAEVSRRCQEIDKGTVELRDADDVFAKAYAALK